MYKYNVCSKKCQNRVHLTSEQAKNVKVNTFTFTVHVTLHKQQIFYCIFEFYVKFQEFLYNKNGIYLLKKLTK